MENHPTLFDQQLPYGGTSGWSGSDTSKERAERNDSDGTTLDNQKKVLELLRASGYMGYTWQELSRATGWHHGTASGVLSVLHKTGHIARLRNKRNRCAIYVIPSHVQGRETAEHKRNSTDSEIKRLRAEVQALRAEIEYWKGLVP